MKQTLFMMGLAVILSACGRIADTTPVLDKVSVVSACTTDQGKTYSIGQTWLDELNHCACTAQGIICQLIGPTH